MGYVLEIFEAAHIFHNLVVSIYTYIVYESLFGAVNCKLVR